MTDVQCALYARVSSESQARDNTIASQVAALRERIVADGFLLEPDHSYEDEGYSGSILSRPALERLRDAVAGGRIERIYVHAPDRLARRYAHQVLLIDEFRRAGAEVVFLNRPIGGTAEDDLLLQVQGVIAEYERAKILERSRRGRRHAARSGSVSALTGAPFGYRYVSRVQGGGVSRFEVVEDEAHIVSGPPWCSSACGRRRAAARSSRASPVRASMIFRWSARFSSPFCTACFRAARIAPPTAGGRITGSRASSASACTTSTAPWAGSAKNSPNTSRRAQRPLRRVA